MFSLSRVRVWHICNAISPPQTLRTFRTLRSDVLSGICWSSAQVGVLLLHLNEPLKALTFQCNRLGELPPLGSRPRSSVSLKRRPFADLSPRVSICRRASLSALQTGRMLTGRRQLGRDFHHEKKVHFQLLIGAPHLAVQQNRVGQTGGSGKE